MQKHTIAAILILCLSSATSAQKPWSKRAPVFRVNPTQFAPGTSVGAHVEIADNSYPGPARFSCGDPIHPDRFVQSDPVYALILVQLKDDGTTADLKTAPLHTSIPYAPTGTDWKTYDLPAIETPSALSWPKLQAVFAYARTIPAYGGEACTPVPDVQPIRTHDYKLICGKRGTSCHYVPTDGYPG